MSNSSYIESIKEEKQRLTDRLKRLEAGEELCDHHWNGSDNCYETYCTGCQRHTGEYNRNDSIPFKADNYCYSCKRTPEEIAAEQALAKTNIEKAEVATLKQLLEKYPEVIQGLINKL